MLTHRWQLTTTFMLPSLPRDYTGCKNTGLHETVEQCEALPSILGIISITTLQFYPGRLQEIGMPAQGSQQLWHPSGFSGLLDGAF